MKAGKKGHLRAVTSTPSVAILTFVSTAAIRGSMLSPCWENQSSSHADRLDIPEIHLAATSFMETDKHWLGKLPNHKIRISGSGFRGSSPKIYRRSILMSGQCCGVSENMQKNKEKQTSKKRERERAASHWSNRRGHQRGSSVQEVEDRSAGVWSPELVGKVGVILHSNKPLSQHLITWPIRDAGGSLMRKTL